MSTSRRTWQKSEGRAAALFGSLRAVLSGSSGRTDKSASDSTHPTLFIESKMRQTHAARTLHSSTMGLAKKEGKVPVLCLFDKGRPGFLVVVHSDDMPRVVAEYLGAMTDEELEEIEGAIRRAVRRNRGLQEGGEA